MRNPPPPGNKAMIEAQSNFKNLELYVYADIYNVTTVEPLITDTAGEFKFCPL
jgi:hypothetical protein